MGMVINDNYGMSVFTLIFTAFLLVLTCINHSRETKCYQILKSGLWFLLVNEVLDFFYSQVTYAGKMYSEPAMYVIFVGYFLAEETVMILIMMYGLFQVPQFSGHSQLLNTIFFVCQCTVTVLILTTNLTGFVYSIEKGRLVQGIALGIFYIAHLMMLTGFLILILRFRRRLAPRLFQNEMAMLVLALVIHILPFFVKDLNVFGFFANAFWATAFFLFHSGTYEGENARMGVDMYRSEFDFRLSKKMDFYIFETRILNYDQLVERRLYCEEELDAICDLLETKTAETCRKAMVFHKEQESFGVITPRMHSDEAAELAGQMCEWMNDLFSDRLHFSIVAARCPKYAAQFADAERLICFLQKKCPENNYYFCNEADYEEFTEREEILRLLHDMHLEKEDVVLFGRPVIECGNSRVKCLEILCRLQMAGSGIIHSEHVIRLAEQYGYIHDVNMAVLCKVCDFLATDIAIREKLRVSLHISSRELKRAGFAKDVLAIIKDYELEPGLLEFEVTMMPDENDIDRMREEMNLLREHQIAFTLTDFDPTIANFESVMGLPFEVIKFERHCVKRASEQAMCYDVIGTLVDLFKERGLRVAFKGIDNARLEEIAVSLRADFLQGEKYTKPFPVERMEEIPELQGIF